jgi:hypothetical protein
MHGRGLHTAELVFLSLLAFVVLFAAVARYRQRVLCLLATDEGHGHSTVSA